MPCTEAQKGATLHTIGDKIASQSDRLKTTARRYVLLLPLRVSQCEVYIMQACKERMQRDGFTPPDGADQADT